MRKRVLFLRYFLYIFMFLSAVHTQTNSNEIEPFSISENDKLLITRNLAMEKEKVLTYQEKIGTQIDLIEHIQTAIRDRHQENIQKLKGYNPASPEYITFQKNSIPYEMGLTIGDYFITTEKNLTDEITFIDKIYIISSFYALVFYKTGNPEYEFLFEILYYAQEHALRGNQLFKACFVILKFFVTCFNLNDEDHFSYDLAESPYSTLHIFLTLYNKTKYFLNKPECSHLTAQQAEIKRIHNSVFDFISIMPPETSNITGTMNDTSLINNVLIHFKDIKIYIIEYLKHLEKNILVVKEIYKQALKVQSHLPLPTTPLMETSNINHIERLSHLNLLKEVPFIIESLRNVPTSPITNNAVFIGLIKQRRDLNYKFLNFLSNKSIPNIEKIKCLNEVRFLDSINEQDNILFQLKNIIAKQIDVYSIAISDRLLAKKNLDPEKKQDFFDELYILLTIHKKNLHLECFFEETVTQKLIDYMIDKASPEAKEYAESINVSKEKEIKNKYRYTYNDNIIDIIEQKTESIKPALDQLALKSADLNMHQNQGILNKINELSTILQEDILNLNKKITEDLNISKLTIHKKIYLSLLMLFREIKIKHAICKENINVEFAKIDKIIEQSISLNDLGEGNKEKEKENEAESIEHNIICSKISQSEEIKVINQKQHLEDSNQLVENAQPLSATGIAKLLSYYY